MLKKISCKVIQWYITKNHVIKQGLFTDFKVNLSFKNQVI